MKRFPSGIMCTCVIPWDDRGEFIEELFVHEVRTMLELTPLLYVFGTAGEGHAVSNGQFERITRVFCETMRAGGAEPMVGIIGLSLPAMCERIELAREMGVRRFQISLPSWGELTDGEVRTFFREVCGRYGDCQFMHYNLLRAKRLVTPELYAELADEHANLVATKNCTDSMLRLEGLMRLSPQLQHFPGEVGYIYASQLGECGLLASLATNQASCRAFFEAGRRRDLPTLLTMHAAMREIFGELHRAVGPAAHIDSAFDKMLWKLVDERFPLRLLPPYQASTEAAFGRIAEFVRTRHPQWLPEGESGAAIQ